MQAKVKTSKSCASKRKLLSNLKIVVSRFVDLETQNSLFLWYIVVEDQCDYEYTPGIEDDDDMCCFDSSKTLNIFRLCFGSRINAVTVKFPSA